MHFLKKQCFISFLVLQLLSVCISAQITVTGTVNDEKGGPLSGVSIKVKGAETGTATDANGKYSISLSNAGSSLLFTYVVIGCSTNMNITDRKVSSTAKVVHPNIVVRDFKVVNPTAGKVKVTMSAEGQGGIKVGSYVIRVAEVLPRREMKELPGLGPAHDLPYFVAKDFKERQGILLKDNGELDEDPRQGVFATTLSTAEWPTGRYFIIMFHLNCPIFKGILSE